MRFVILFAIIALTGCESSSVSMSLSIDTACNVSAVQEFRQNGQLMQLDANQLQTQEDLILRARQQAGCA